MSADAASAGKSNAAAATGGRRARVWSIAPGRPFLDTLASAILDGRLPEADGRPPDRLALASTTILLPTRRAVRALQDAFLRAARGRALLLPRLVPIAESDEDQGLLADLAGGSSPLGAEFTLPPAIGKLERQLALTNLVMAWSEQQAASARSDPDGERSPPAGTTTPAHAARLAADLARLMDMIETEDRTLDGLADLVPADFSEHWQRTIDFLKIVTQFWPAHLDESGLLSPADRRNRLIRAEAERLRNLTPRDPVIVAGVTGSVPATVDLIGAVAALPAGAVVIPGLDRDLDEAGWADVRRHPEHPQHGLALLLDRLGVARASVGEIAGAPLSREASARTAFLSEAMRPAGATGNWQAYVATADRTEVAAALAGVTRIDAPSAADEAEVIALMMREALETAGRTAALVSPDRLLARRVAIRLESWGITVDDSAGRPLAKTPPGAFLELIAAAVASRFAPADVMALLKHPMTRLGLPISNARRTARALEVGALRTVYLGEGLDGLEANLARAWRETLDHTRRDRAARRLWDADWDNAHDLVRRLREAVAPLAALAGQGDRHALHRYAGAHRAAAEAIARGPDEASTGQLWEREDGEAADQLLDALDDASLPAPQIGPDDYPDLYRTLSGSVTVRPRVAVHPRLSIWGPYEARLQQPDLVILGSLNEGTWPASADPGAWLNRPMRAKLGLPSPEDTIGRAALDVSGLFGAREVVITRASRVDGAPTVPSRWLMRIDALLDGLKLAGVLCAEKPWLGWARARDWIEGASPPARAPEPRPALHLRPRTLNVTDVELWIRNPYGLYARRILGLEALPPLGAVPGAREKGIIIHDALSRFTRRFPDALPGDIAAMLMASAEEALAEYAANARVRAFWRPRIGRFADWFARTEPGRRQGVTGLIAEVSGSRVIASLPGGPFTLRARADRIDLKPDCIILTDYKTGAPPANSEVVAGKAPQLPLEAAIAASGGFEKIEAASVAALRFISARGGEPAGEEREVASTDANALGAFCLAGLTKLVARYDDQAQAYAAVRRSRFDYRYDDFAHLARVAEWSGGEIQEDEDEAQEATE